MRNVLNIPQFLFHRLRGYPQKDRDAARLLAPSRWPEMSEDQRAELIAHILLFQVVYPEGESSELADYIVHHYARIFGPRGWPVKSFKPIQLTQEIDGIRKYTQNPHNKFELIYQKPLFMTDDQVQQVLQFRLDVEVPWIKSPQQKKDDLKANWAYAGISGSRFPSSQPITLLPAEDNDATLMPAGDNDAPPPYSTDYKDNNDP